MEVHAVHFSMNNEEARINEESDKVRLLLTGERLQEALEIMGNGMQEVTVWELHMQYDNIDIAYRYLLDYFRKGINDPTRASMHRELIGKALLLNDSMRDVRLALSSSRLYYQVLNRKGRAQPLSSYQAKLEAYTDSLSVSALLPDDEMGRKQKETAAKTHEDNLAGLFYELWTQEPWNAIQHEEAEQLVSSPLISVNDSAMAVSAVTLSLLHRFDPLKCLFLCRTYRQNEEIMISQRALVGFVLATYLYDKQIPYFPELQAATELLCDDKIFRSHLLTLQCQLLRTRQTQEIDRKMREEIIPAMLKNPNLRNVKLGIDLEKEMQEEDFNPEWEKWIGESGIKEKLVEMTEWQMEGADVYMSTFAQLKNFPFFKEMANWFRPFDPTQPDVQKVLPDAGIKNNMFLKAILSSPFFCNSDKYSFCLTIHQIPEGQRKAFVNQMREQNEASQEDPDMSGEKMTALRKAEIYGNQYLQDLYRFFKLYPRHRDFSDPFRLSLNLQECDVLARAARQPEFLKPVGDFLMKNRYYSEALQHYRMIITLQEKNGDQPQANLYQQIGYCLQKNGDNKAAAEAYHTADLLQPDNLWNLRHIAQCYRLLKKPKKAVIYYLQAEKMDPENIKLLLQTGECLMSLERYDEAFTRFYKVVYLEPESARSQRAVAWCSLVTGNVKQAQKYYDKLLAQKEPQTQDYLNAGHAAWADMKNVRAIELYRKGLAASPRKDEFFADFFNDRETLSLYGITTTDMVLMRDAVLLSSIPTSR